MIERKLPEDEDLGAKVYGAIFNVQQAIEGVKKDGTNPFTKSQYITLDNLWDVLRPLLKPEKLVVIQKPGWVDGAMRLYTEVRHLEDLSCVSMFLDLPFGDRVPTAQEIGGAITYARRYSITALFGIVADVDDDGNQASGRTEKAPAGRAVAPAQSAPKPMPARPVATTGTVRTKTYGTSGVPATPDPEQRVLTQDEYNTFQKYMTDLGADQYAIKKYLATTHKIPEYRDMTVRAARDVKTRAEQGFFNPELTES
jgi:hypothetical protein